MTLAQLILFALLLAALILGALVLLFTHTSIPLRWLERLDRKATARERGDR